MRTNRRFAAVPLCAVLAVALCALPVGRAEAAGTEDAAAATATAAATAAGWCARGATFAVLFSAALSVPSMVFGGGPSYTLARAGASALMGCGVAVTWRSFAQGLAYIDGVMNPLPPVPADPAPPRRAPTPPKPPLVNTSG